MRYASGLRFSNMSSYFKVVLWLLYANLMVGATFLSMREQFKLVPREAKLIDTLQKYVEAERTRLDELKKFQNAVMKNVELYKTEDELAWNPVAIFKTVKHLTADLEKAKEVMSKNSFDDTVTKSLKGKKIVLPDENNLYETIQALITLQEQCNVTVADMMGGRLAADQTVESGLTVQDCFYIAQKSAEKQDHETAVKWFKECGNRVGDHLQDEAASILIPSALFMGDKELCRKAVNRCLFKDPTNRKLQDLNVKLGLALGNWQWETETDQWESFKTCVGDYETEVFSRNLKCRYNHHNSPFLVIAPLKEEMLSLAPKISVFREVLYESEIELLKGEAYHLFRTATVLKDEAGRRAADLNYRPSQTAFINNQQPQYTSLRNRLQDISSLSLMHGENFQMLHYAPGGFYRVHADFLYSTPDVQMQGNRIATALMYLNDVTSGGSTVFPRQKTAVRPITGSILFWINMRVDGSEEHMTRHAACPVIYGEKIACTQWFRIKGQDHWIAEPEDDLRGTYSVNPNVMCLRKT